MINLIPNHEKKKKVKDFYFRLIIVFVAMLGLCATIGIVALLPTYFLTSAEKNLAEQKLVIQKTQPIATEDQTIVEVVADLDQKLSLIDKFEQSKYLVSQKIIQQIAIRKMSDIKIHKIMYENSVEGKKVILEGRAPSRERLLSFRRALEDDVAWKEVDLPISNFVKGSNIEFSLSLIPS